MTLAITRRMFRSSPWILWVCAALFGFSAGALANVSQEEVDKYYANMKKAVSMEDDQLLQIQAINKDFGAKFKTLSSEEVSRWKKIRKARSLSKDQKKSIQNVLNDDQYTLYLEFVESEGKKLRQAIKDKRNAKKEGGTEV